MVIILSKTLEKKKGVNDVRPENVERRLRELHTMSKGTTLFSCGPVEADRWLDLGRSCAIQQRAPCQSSASLRDVGPEPGGQHWAKEPGSAIAITSLIRDLNLANCSMTSACSSATPTTAHYTTTATSQAPTAPPSKRQCRSLSFSDELSGFRSSWRPQGSRVWTAVEKRRCHSGGNVRGGGGGYSGGHFPPIQRSSSFSFPSCSSIHSDGALDLPFFNQRLPLHPQFTASPVSPTSPSSHHHHSFHHHHLLRPLSLSHEQISLPELQREETTSEASSPDSTPELGRRAGQRSGGTGCLSRSRSQPCVLNDKKIGMKRRRPEDAQEQRPSLDLAKMTQTLQTFQSLSCPGFSPTDSYPSSLLLSSSSQPNSDFTAVSKLGLESTREVAGDDDDEEEEEEEEEDFSYEELDSDSACSVDSRPGSPVGVTGSKRTLWKGECVTQRDIFQLGGELDLDQIERN